MDRPHIPGIGFFYGKRTLLLLAALLLSLPLLAGYAVLPGAIPVPELVDQSYLHGAQTTIVGELNDGVTLSQSFLPGRDGLSQLRLVLATYDRPNAGEMTFTLLDDLGRIVHREQVAADTIVDGNPKNFRFPPQVDSAGRAYTLQITATSPIERSTTAWSHMVDRYPGQLRRNGEPLPGDLMMEWHYQPATSVLWLHVARGLPRYGLPLLLGVLLWTLPGLALLAWLRERSDETWSVQRLLGAAVALSGALLVILPQFTHLIALPLGSWSVWALLLLSVALLLVARRQGRPIAPTQPPDGIMLLYLTVLALIVGSRFLALHQAAAPLWGDSVHHTLITQLILDRGGIPDNYLPYVPLSSFTYHSGFHLLCAWLAWSVLPGMAPLSASETVLLGGQLQGVWAVVMVGLLAEGLSRHAGRPEKSRWAGIVALLVVGLLSPMPAFYVNWGRYTQLAGQIFLPAALLWTLQAWQPDQPRRRLLPITLMLAVMALTHYRVVMMYAVALPLLLLLLLWRSRESWRTALAGMARRMALSGTVAGVLVLPWYWDIASGLLLRKLEAIATAPTEPPGKVLQEYNAFGDITTHVPEWLLVAAGLSFLWLLLRRQGVALLLGGWTLALFALANPYTFLRLPGTGLVNNFMIQIALYLPLATLVALGTVDGVYWLRTLTPIPVRPLGLSAALIVLYLAIPRAWEQMQVVDVHHYAMQTPLDQRAARWIAKNTQQGATFHINGFPAFGGAVVAGSDGGWWLWQSAQRQTTIPPMIYDSERGFDPEYRYQVNSRYARLQAAHGDPTALAATMREEGVDYLYIGAQQGRVGLPPDMAPLDPLALDTSPAFETLYTDDLVWVFKVDR
ncbi:MAG: hypothetical protein M3220_03370 [Chloroflexota bacterium]|nr:hypothetical protein [Chloroflexota bacterium]